MEKTISRAIILACGKSFIQVRHLGLDDSESFPLFPSDPSKPGNPEPYAKLSNEGKINKQQKKLLQAIIDKGRLRNRDLHQVLNISDEAIRKNLSYLCSLGILEKNGENKGTHYTLKNWS